MASLPSERRHRAVTGSICVVRLHGARCARVGRSRARLGVELDGEARVVATSDTRSNEHA
jgi:hypothetical protein